MTYGNFKYLPRKALSYRVLRDEVFEIPSKPQYDGYQHGLALYIFFNKKSEGTNKHTGTKIISETQQLAIE